MTNKILEKFERIWGHSSGVFIPECKKHIDVLKSNLNYSKEELEYLKQRVRWWNAKIKITEKLINMGIQK